MRTSQMFPRAITPTGGLWDELDLDMQNFLSEIAYNVASLLARGKSDDAYDEMESHGLGPDEQVALWTRFTSGQRRILKAVAATRKDRM